MSNEKEYTVTVRLPHTCKDDEWDQEENPCVACKHKEAYERSLDVSDA